MDGQCQTCARRSDWDFLKEFYQREEINRQQVQNLNGHVTQLNAALHHAGLNSQKDRLALNKSHDHIRELQGGFEESSIARAKLENDLHEERQEHRMCQESLTHEQVRHGETEKSLERLGDIVSKVECRVDSESQKAYTKYNITEMVLEVEAKACKIEQLEGELERRTTELESTIHQLEEQLRTTSSRHEEELVSRDISLSELELQLRKEKLRPSINIDLSDLSQNSGRGRRRKRCRGRGKSKKLSKGPEMTSEGAAVGQNPT
ncbi:MAG: hypothetical protein Q9217_002663 [Psora testacea]